MPSADDNVAPMLGIFWCVLVAPEEGSVHLLSQRCALDQAEEYGDCLTAPAGHLETWEAWARGELVRHVPPVAAVIRCTEYEEWPRGRIVFDRAADRFVLYADRQLLQHAPVIRGCFNLPEQTTVLRTDQHYRSTRRLPASTKLFV